MSNQEKNLSAVNDFRNHANIISRNTVIVVKAMVSYYDKVLKQTLFKQETEVHIDTTKSDQITIPDLAYDNRCFCEFSIHYQNYKYESGVLTIDGSGFGSKNAYCLTIV